MDDRQEREEGEGQQPYELEVGETRHRPFRFRVRFRKLPRVRRSSYRAAITAATTTSCRQQIRA